MKYRDFIFGKSFHQEDFLTQDKYLEFAESVPWLQYVKTDTLFYPLENWRGKHLPLFAPQKPIVISGHSDFPIKQEYLPSLLQGPVRKWFAINADCDDNRVIGIPHGLTNDCSDTELHPILGNQQILCDILSEEKQDPVHLLYMNFNTQTDIRTKQPVRQLLWNTFSLLPFVHKKEFTYEKLTLQYRKEYLQDIYKSKFVLCPQGNGIDTVRLWETLYCGAIPIVMRHRAMRYFEDLPILWVNDWTEVMDPIYLESQYESIMQNDWNLDALKIGYWKEKIENEYKSGD